MLDGMMKQVAIYARVSTGEQAPVFARIPNRPVMKKL
jgi:hypothetical protein